MIEMKNVNYSYSSDLAPAIKNVNLQINDGTWVSILGHNGSGKSTLAKLLVGLLEADSGQIFVDGILLEEKSINDTFDTERVHYNSWN